MTDHEQGPNQIEHKNVRLISDYSPLGVGLCVDVALLALTSGVVRAYMNDIRSRVGLVDSAEEQAAVIQFAGEIGQVAEALDEVRVTGALIPMYLTKKVLEPIEVQP